jgi:hypothetical protein
VTVRIKTARAGGNHRSSHAAAPGRDLEGARPRPVTFDHADRARSVDGVKLTADSRNVQRTVACEPRQLKPAQKGSQLASLRL